jgi:hypothetical protein
LGGSLGSGLVWKHINIRETVGDTKQGLCVLLIIYSVMFPCHKNGHKKTQIKHAEVLTVLSWGEKMGLQTVIFLVNAFTQSAVFCNQKI